MSPGSIDEDEVLDPEDELEVLDMLEDRELEAPLPAELEVTAPELLVELVAALVAPTLEAGADDDLDPVCEPRVEAVDPVELRPFWVLEVPPPFSVAPGEEVPHAAARAASVAPAMLVHSANNHDPRPRR